MSIHNLVGKVIRVNSDKVAAQDILVLKIVPKIKWCFVVGVVGEHQNFSEFKFRMQDGSFPSSIIIIREGTDSEKRKGYYALKTKKEIYLKKLRSYLDDNRYNQKQIVKKISKVLDDIDSINNQIKIYVEKKVAIPITIIPIQNFSELIKDSKIYEVEETLVL